MNMYINLFFKNIKSKCTLYLKTTYYIKTSNLAYTDQTNKSLDRKSHIRNIVYYISLYFFICIKILTHITS